MIATATTAHVEPDLRNDGLRGAVTDLALFLNCDRCGRVDTRRRFTNQTKALEAGARAAIGHDDHHRAEDARAARIAADPFDGLT